MEYLYLIAVIFILTCVIARRDNKLTKSIDEDSKKYLDGLATKANNEVNN